MPPSFEVVEIPLKDLKPNPFQKRKAYGDIPSLAESISQQGLQNPISVIKIKENGYVIVSGHRRFEAFKCLKRKTIPAYIRKESNENDLVKDIAIENLQRKDLTPVELAETLLQLIYTIETVRKEPSRAMTLLNQIKLYNSREGVGSDFTGKYGFREEDLFLAMKVLKLVGMSVNTATSYIRILQLPEEIQDSIVSSNKNTVNALPDGKINVKLAYELTRINDADLQKDLFNKAVLEKLKYINVKPLVDEIVQNEQYEYRNLGKGSGKARSKADGGMLELTDNLFALSSTVWNFRAKLPIVCRRLDKLLWLASLQKMKKACMEMIRSINALLTEDLKAEGMIDFVNSDLELTITAPAKKGDGNRFSIPMDKMRELKLKDGDTLMLKVEGVIRR